MSTGAFASTVSRRFGLRSFSSLTSTTGAFRRRPPSYHFLPSAITTTTYNKRNRNVISDPSILEIPISDVNNNTSFSFTRSVSTSTRPSAKSSSPTPPPSSSSSSSSSVPPNNNKKNGNKNNKKQKSKSMSQQIQEHAQLQSEGRISQHDPSLLPQSSTLQPFPRIKTTSLSTKRIVISDEAMSVPATLVLVAFRNFADDQLNPWRQHFTSNFPRLRWFDVTVNESFAAQALSGFVQRWQRGYIDLELHDFYVSFNSKMRQPLESLLLSDNRMFGNVLLLDNKARVRFRAAGPPTEKGLDVLVKCTQQLIKEAKHEK